MVVNISMTFNNVVLQKWSHLTLKRFCTREDTCLKMQISWWNSVTNEVECLRVGPRYVCLSQSLQEVIMPRQVGHPTLPLLSVSSCGLHSSSWGTPTFFVHKGYRGDYPSPGWAYLKPAYPGIS